MNTYNWPTLSYEDTENLNTSIAKTEIKWIIKTFQTEKRSGLNKFTSQLLEILKKFHFFSNASKTEHEEILPNSCCKPSVTFIPKSEKTQRTIDQHTRQQTRKIRKTVGMIHLTHTSINVIHYITMLKKNFCFNRCRWQHDLRIKIFRNVSIAGTFLDTIKVIYYKPIANIKLNGE